MQMEARVLHLKSQSRAVPSSEPLSKQEGSMQLLFDLKLLDECARQRTGAECPFSLNCLISPLLSLGGGCTIENVGYQHNWWNKTFRVGVNQ